MPNGKKKHYNVFKRMRFVTIKSILALFSVSFILYILYISNTSQQQHYPYSDVDQKDVQTRLHHVTHKDNKNFTIHIWMHGERMKRRFLRSYGSKTKDPYKYCSVNNCVLSTNSSEVELADAVFFHLHQTKGPQTFPQHRPSGQHWIFFTDESPYNTFMLTRRYSMKDYNGLFNWSMTYRRDSDIYMPYGRTVPLSDEEKKNTMPNINYAKTKTGTVCVLSSNCGGINRRWKYIRELDKHIQVDIYGRCGTLKCPGYFAHDCPLINDYKFYLAFENSNCKEYITEKLWWNSYHKNVVPVVMGAPKKDYEELCPPHSFIHVDDFKTPQELAEYLNMLDSNDTAYNEYFRWKDSYKVLNEHGYFGSSSLHLCRICEKLNSAFSQHKIHNNLETYWNANTDCSKPKWIILNNDDDAK